MGIGLSTDMVNNLVNNIYRANGLHPASASRADGLKTTKGVRSHFGDAYVPSSELKQALNDPGNHLALSLEDKYHPDSSHALATYVAEGLDQADGSGDGWIRLTDRGQWADLLAQYTGPQKAGYISTDALEWGLESGRLVLGEGGQLMTRDDAKGDGDQIVAIHEDKAGATLALDQNTRAE